MSVHISIDHNTAGTGATQVNNVTNNIAFSGKDETRRACLKALACPDSFKVKNRLKQKKDDLLNDSFQWILSDEQYCRWRQEDDISLLWIKGGAGKGKTMMSIGLIEALSQQKDTSRVVAYFFCQNADSSLNTIAALLKGLILRLLEQRDALWRVLTKRWNSKSGSFEEDLNSWNALWDIFLEMISICQSSGDIVFVVVDALDECLGDDMSDFLNTLIRTGLYAPGQLKWLLASRPLEMTEDFLRASASRAYTIFDLKSDRVAAGVKVYIDEQIRQLALKQKVDRSVYDAAAEEIHARSNGTFLWASFVCKELMYVPPQSALSVVASTPLELQGLYTQAYANYTTATSQKGTRYAQMLSVLLLAYRPLTLPELADILDLPAEDADTRTLVMDCSTFVTIRAEDGIEHVEFVHQSARDFLSGHANTSSDNAAFNHERMVSRCLSILNRLYVNLCSCSTPSTSRSEALKNGKHAVTRFSYAAVHWISHLEAIADYDAQRQMLRDRGDIYNFLHNKFLEWLECLSLMQNLRSANKALESLLDTLSRKRSIQNDRTPPFDVELSDMVLAGLSMSQDEFLLQPLVKDEQRFLVRNSRLIARYPLQIYSSALVFSPESSIVKQNNIDRIPKWLQHVPKMAVNWSSLQQTLIGHSDGVNSVAFSPDGKMLASASDDKTVKLWSTQTGLAQRTLRGHEYVVIAVAFSPDGQWVASSSNDDRVIIWSVRTGEVERTLRYLKNRAFSLAFSPNSQLLAIGCEDYAIRLWSLEEKKLCHTLRDHWNWIRSVAFSPDGQLLASCSDDQSVKLWSVSTGELQRSLSGHSFWINSVDFSPDGKLLASGSRDKTVKLWSVETGKVEQTFKYQSELYTVKFSPDGRLLALGSFDEVVTLLSVRSGREWQTFTGHSKGVQSVMFSPDGSTLASGSHDNTIKLWSVDPWSEEEDDDDENDNNDNGNDEEGEETRDAEEDEEDDVEDYLAEVTNLTVSPDEEMVASSNRRRTIKLWSAKLGTVQQDLPSDSSNHYNITFSPDMRLVTSSGSASCPITVWSVISGEVLHTIKAHSEVVTALVFSRDSQYLVSSSEFTTIKIWSMQTGQLQQSMRIFTTVNAMAISPNGDTLALGQGIQSTGKATLWSFSTCLGQQGGSFKRLFQSRESQGLLRTIETGRLIDKVQFTHDGTQLVTNHGRYFVSNGESSEETELEYIDTRLVVSDGHWISCGSVPLLKIPSEFRVSAWDSHRDTIALGRPSGRVLCFKIDRDMVLSDDKRARQPKAKVAPDDSD